MLTRKSLSIALPLVFPLLGPNAAAENADGAAMPDVPLMTVIVTGTPVSAEHGIALDTNRLPSLRAATGDTASLFRDVPGFSLVGAGGVSSLPSIHGLSDDRLRIKVDGMDLISACASHMNPPLSYIDPATVGSATVLAGLAPVSSGGDSIGGTILVDAAAPAFAKAGEGVLKTGEVGTFYRSNGNAVGARLSASLAGDTLSVIYSGSNAQSGNYTAGGDFKPAGPAFTDGGPSLYTSTKWLDADTVGSSQYKSTNHSLGFALRHDHHRVDLKLGYQHIPYQAYPNQRMDMTDNMSRQANLGYAGRYAWGALTARVYREHTRHEMNFLEDKAFWYQRAGQTVPAPGMPMLTEGRNTGAMIKGDIALSAREELRVGGEVQQYRLDDWWPPSGNGGMSPNTFWNINDGQRDRYAAFAEWETRWTPRWLGLFGVRHETVLMDSGPVQGYNAAYAADANAFNAADRERTDRNWDVTALARYTADKTRTVEFGYVRKTRSPNLHERYTWSTNGMAMFMVNMAGDGNGYVGNLDLAPEIAHTLSASFDLHDAETGAWKLNVTPYYTYVDDYVNARRLSSSTKATDEFVFLKFVNQDAQLYGFDVSGHFPLATNTAYGSFTANGMLSYVRGKTTAGGDDNLYNIMPLNARLTVTQRIRTWTHSAEVHLVDRKSDVSQVRNEVETPAYALLNLRSSYAWKKARLDFGIDNVFDRLYFHPLGGAYVGQGVTMPSTPIPGATPPWGTPVPGMGRSVYAGLNVKF